MQFQKPNSTRTHRSLWQPPRREKDRECMHILQPLLHEQGKLCPHMKNRHGLPVWATDATTQSESPNQAGPSRARMTEREPPKQGASLSKPVQSAFNGDVEVYNIKPTMEIDLLAYLNSVK